jgi:hypothetical protein
MAGQKNQYKFSKEMLNRHSKNAYQDPTYLSFTIMFDPTSPLFSPGDAAKTLRDFYKEPKRAAKLTQFTDTIQLLNKEMPWYWKSIEGIDRVVTYHDNRKDAYAGGDDAKITITCNETINLAITGLMDLYREALYDNAAWTQTLPENYRRFRMWVIVSEVRKINSADPNSLNIVDWDDIENSATEFTPMFKFEFDKCEFVPNSASEAFASLSSSEPTMATDLKINIKYETIKRIDEDTNYLQGIVTSSVPDQYIEDAAEGREGLGNRVARDVNGILQDNIDRFGRSVAKANPARLVNNPDNVYGSQLDRLYQSGLNNLGNFTTGIARTPENIYKDAVVNIESGANAFRQALNTNIYGAAGMPVNEALKRGAIASIFPLINNQEGFGRGDLGNVNG